MPTLTFDETAAESILNAFGWQVAHDPDGLVVDEAGEPVECLYGHQITVGQVAGVVADENGESALLRDNFAALVDYTTRMRQQRGSDE